MLIALVGLPGGGKSTVGKQLARRLGVGFIDSDAVIERQLNQSIKSFFEQEGEDRFRDIEQQVIAELVATHEGVLATGGGVPLRAANRDELRRRSVVVYLRSTPEDLFRRLKRDKQRPLLQVEDPLSVLRHLHEARDPLYYDVANFVIDTGQPSIAALVNRILMQLELTNAAASESFKPSATSGSK